MWVHLGRKRRGKAIPHGARGAPAPTPPLPEAESSRRLANEINSHFTAALAPGTMCENYYSLRFVGKREEKEKKKKEHGGERCVRFFAPRPRGGFHKSISKFTLVFGGCTSPQGKGEDGGCLRPILVPLQAQKPSRILLRAAPAWSPPPRIETPGEGKIQAGCEFTAQLCGAC